MKQEFKVGDKVVMKGVVKNIDENKHYPIIVKIEGIGSTSFEIDGNCNISFKTQSLFHDTEPQERVVQVRNTEKEEWLNRVFIMEKNTEKEEWLNRVFIMEKKTEFICWSAAETFEDSKRVSTTTTWNFMRELPTKRKITMQEIAEKFDVDIDQIEIT